MKEEAASRMEDWPEVEHDLSLTQEDWVERLYTPGEPGEEYCDKGKDYTFCTTKLQGPWGDSIPQNGTNCLLVSLLCRHHYRIVLAMLELQYPIVFCYGQSNTNTANFEAFSCPQLRVFPPCYNRKFSR
ncbi:expressed unknown protein [Seminavis robusta]|uniref:Uncharacterized protein n=1 Tax=Seminavis robusta TaxID=568900 RepID=A0A9N8E147_9STRA|nr:expressed unknown protein [Seminavis robusta]|eukprot:Sro542_g163350.1 n/a (129) ;mRNA; f:19164-19698